MSLDVNKIIMNSLDEVILSEGEQEAREQVEEDLANNPALKYIRKIKSMEDESDLTGKLHSGIHKLKRSVSDTMDEAKEKATSIGTKISDIVKEHPGISAAAAAALAAGVGALALRKRLKKAKEEIENNG